MALESGIPILSQMRQHHKPAQFNPRERREFLRGCHRGYEKAQSTVFRLLQEIDADRTLPSNDKYYRSLLLRKVIDSIIYTLLRQELHVMRRLVIHYDPPPINMEDASRVMSIVDRMNAESRMTFAVAADLSTCVHLCDIVRIDHRDGARVQLIEVKSGKCNALLSTFLDQFPSTTESLSIVKDCGNIPQGMRKQAQRMMRQRVRLSQAIEVINTDKGIDPMMQCPIQFTSTTYAVAEFDDSVDEICQQAISNKVAGGVINDCIHICVASGDTRGRAIRNALDIAPLCICKHRQNRPVILETDSELASFVPPKERFQMFQPIISNLNNCACRPLPIWRIARPHLFKILSGELAVLFFFDIAGFVWTAKDLGYTVRFSSRHETDFIIKQYGIENVAQWGNRMVILNCGHGEQTMLSGTFARFINNLQCPRGILIGNTKSEQAGFQYAAPVKQEHTS